MVPAELISSCMRREPVQDARGQCWSADLSSYIIQHIAHANTSVCTVCTLTWASSVACMPWGWAPCQGNSISMMPMMVHLLLEAVTTHIKPAATPATLNADATALGSGLHEIPLQWKFRKCTYLRPVRHQHPRFLDRYTGG